jgi:hypothetical protein
MPLLVDGIERNLSTTRQAFREEVTSVIENIQESGRFIRTVTLNGNEITVGDLLKRDLNSSDEVSVVTGSLDELIEDTMASAKEYTPRLIGAFAECTKLLRTGNIGEAGSLFSDAVQGVQWTFDVWRNLASFHPGPSPVHELYEQSKNVIPQLFQAWDSRDYVLLADVVEYEWIPLLQYWLQVTEVFSSQMKAERLKQGLFQ